MAMSYEKVAQEIDEMRGEDGWWRQSGASTFRALLKELVEIHQIAPEAALSILHRAHNAVAGEFGA
jgi:hypothetical protein